MIITPAQTDAFTIAIEQELEDYVPSSFTTVLVKAIENLPVDEWRQELVRIAADLAVLHAGAVQDFVAKREEERRAAIRAEEERMERERAERNARRNARSSTEDYSEYYTLFSRATQEASHAYLGRIVYAPAVTEQWNWFGRTETPDMTTQEVVGDPILGTQDEGLPEISTTTGLTMSWEIPEADVERIRRIVLDPLDPYRRTAL